MVHYSQISKNPLCSVEGDSILIKTGDWSIRSHESTGRQNWLAISWAQGRSRRHNRLHTETGEWFIGCGQWDFKKYERMARKLKLTKAKLGRSNHVVEHIDAPCGARWKVQEGRRWSGTGDTAGFSTAGPREAGVWSSVGIYTRSSLTSRTTQMNALMLHKQEKSWLKGRVDLLMPSAERKSGKKLSSLQRHLREPRSGAFQSPDARKGRVWWSQGF